MSIAFLLFFCFVGGVGVLSSCVRYLWYFWWCFAPVGVRGVFLVLCSSAACIRADVLFRAAILSGDSGGRVAVRIMLVAVSMMMVRKMLW